MIENTFIYEQLIEKNKQLKLENTQLRKNNSETIKKFKLEQSLKQYQAELIQMEMCRGLVGIYQNWVIWRARTSAWSLFSAALGCL